MEMMHPVLRYDRGHLIIRGYSACYLEALVGQLVPDRDWPDGREGDPVGQIWWAESNDVYRNYWKMFRIRVTAMFFVCSLLS
jgi:hypothetical protein